MPEPKPSSKNRRAGERRTGPRTAPGSAVWYVLGFLLLLALANAFFVQLQSGETLSYSDFKVKVRADQVQEVTLSDDRVRGVLKPTDGGKGKLFSAIRVTDPKLSEELDPQTHIQRARRCPLADGIPAAPRAGRQPRGRRGDRRGRAAAGCAAPRARARWSVEVSRGGGGRRGGGQITAIGVSQVLHVAG